MSSPLHNLPLQLTSFIGRQRELTEVQQLLGTTRLLTLSGAGGCGKTRLALQIAECATQKIPPNAELQDAGAVSIRLPQFSDGIWLVELAALSDPVHVAQAVASVLGVYELLEVPLAEVLINYLRTKTVLILLDNCEHLISACALLAETLLHACPNVRILATSREAFGIRGEVTWLVPPMTLPNPEHQPFAGEELLAALTRCDAIRLFVERATAALPAFMLTEHNRAAVVQVCQSLDGIPLAIELAAARVKVLAIEQIADRLTGVLGARFYLLTAGSRTALPRHQTLQATIDWSYDLLAEQEQVLFRRLSVFSGSFCLEAVEAICTRANLLPDNPCPQGEDDPGSLLMQAEILSLLAYLVEKSLVVVEAVQQGVARYRLLETIRQYAAAKLQAAGEVEAMRARHLTFFLHFAVEADSRLRGPEQLARLQCLDTEYANLQAALAWSLRGGNEEEPHAYVQVGLSLAGTLSWFWHLRSHFSQGRSWYEQALRVSGAAERGAARAKALQGAGICAQMQSDFVHARLWLEESLALWQELEDKPNIAYALVWLAWVATVPGDHAAARPLAEAGLALYREVGDRWGLALALDTLGSVCRDMGDHLTARSLLEESLTLFRALGDTWGIAEALANLAGVAYLQGEYGASRLWLEEALVAQQALDDKFLRTAALLSLGTIARLQGDDEGAATLCAQCLALAREIDAQWFVALANQQLGFIRQGQGADLQAAAYFQESLHLSWALGATENLLSLVGVTAVAAHQGQWQLASRLCGAVEGLSTNLERPLTPLQQSDYESSIARVRARCNEPLLAAAWAQGQALTREQAVADALALAPAHHPAQVATVSKVEPELRLCALGPARVFQGEHLVSSSEWTYAKARELLFYLLCHPARSKEQIGVVFWPNASPAQLRNSFGGALYHLRRVLGRPDWVVFENDRYAFNRSLPYWFDLEIFEGHLTQAQLFQSSAPSNAIAYLEQAVALYQGDFLEDLTAGDWWTPHREQLHKQVVEALLTLGQLLFSTADYGRAADVYRQTIARDSYTEAAHHELIRCYARKGERGQAMRHYQQLVEFMRDELDLAPALETTTLVERLRRGEEI